MYGAQEDGIDRKAFWKVFFPLVVLFFGLSFCIGAFVAYLTK